MERQKNLYERGKVNCKYSPEDKVWEKNDQRDKGKSPKLQRKWKGPKLVVAKQSEVTYLVADGRRRKPRITHFYILKLYHGDKNPEWMEDFWLDKGGDDRQPSEATDSHDEQYDAGCENSDEQE